MSLILVKKLKNKFIYCSYFNFYNRTELDSMSLKHLLRIYKQDTRVNINKLCKDYNNLIVKKFNALSKF